MAERTEALVALDVLVGERAMTLADAWFLESRETKITGTATIEWLDDAFLRLRPEAGGLIFDRQPPASGTAARA